MLTESAYATGLVVYVVAALLGLWLFDRWLLRRLPLLLRLLVLLPTAALFLTPAYTEPGAETMAPAVVVSAFQWATAGRDAAEHALLPLTTMTGGAAAAGLVLGVIGLLLRRGR